MSYWKKALSIGLAAVMTASMLAGCGGSGGAAKETAASGGYCQEPRLRRIIRLQRIFLPIQSQLFAGRMHGLLISWKADL